MKPRLLALALLLVVVPLAAQEPVVINPTLVTFTASSDHALVDHYDLTVYTSGTTFATVYTRSLGKPTPDGANTISIPLTAITGLLALTKNQAYTATVSAVNSVGAGVSTPSNPFAFHDPPAGPGRPVFK